MQGDARVDGLADHGPVIPGGLFVDRLSQQGGKPGGEILRFRVQPHDGVLFVVGLLEAGCENGQEGPQAQQGGQAGRLHGLGRSRVSVAEEEVRLSAPVFPDPDAVGRGVGSRLGERGHLRGKRPAVIDEVGAQVLPFPPEAADPFGSALAAESPDVDVAGLDPGVCFPNRLPDQRPGRLIVDENGILRGPGHDILGQEQIPHISFVGPADAQGLVENVEDGHRAGGVSLGEAGGVFQGVDGRAPDGDAGRADLFVEFGPAVGRIVQHPDDLLVQPLGHFRPGIDAAESQLRVGAHFGRLAGLGHQALAQADHDGVVFRHLAGQVPEALAHDVGGYGIGVLFDLVDPALVQFGAFAEAAEKPGAQRGQGAGHGELPFHGPAQEGKMGGEFPLHLASNPGDFDVFQPDMEPSQDGFRVVSPLSDAVLAVLTDGIHASPPAHYFNPLSGPISSFYPRPVRRPA